MEARGNRVKELASELKNATHAGSRFFWSDAELVDRETSVRYAKVYLQVDRLSSAIEAGQFVLVRYKEDPCLPRAFSVMSVSDRGLCLFVKTEGRVRERFSRCPMGTPFEVRGPFGTPYSQVVSLKRRYLLIGGGSGAAPLLCFQNQHREMVAGAVYGFRTADVCGLLPRESLVVGESTGVRAVDRAEEVWRKGLGIIACGPESMLRLLARTYRGEPDVYVSLEARIGCGIGTCLGCSIETKSGMRRICTEGPLFAIDELPWLC